MVQLRHAEEEAAGETRDDRGTPAKVAALAQRLESRHQETLTALELEEVGKEVGLEPAFIRAALGPLTSRTGTDATRQPATRRSRRLVSIAWWAAGWVIPIVAAIAG